VFIDSLFLSPNWHLIWYAVFAAVPLGLAFRPGSLQQLAPFFFVAASVAAFLFIFFMIPRYSREAAELTTLNRALLHLMPALYVFSIWCLWGKSDNETPARGS
jgi:hypothetical protein